MSPVVRVRDRYRVGRGNSIHDNVTGGEMWIINDEDPEAIVSGAFIERSDDKLARYKSQIWNEDAPKMEKEEQDYIKRRLQALRNPIT